MRQMGTIAEIEEVIAACKARCEAADMPFHADALAAALHISYDALRRYAAEHGSTARILRAALQECTASVVGYALRADPKSHSMWMFYLRNRAEFTDKGERRDGVGEAPVRFVGEERIT